ncbi:DUF5611 family protein [Halorutilales archaeon Cl-col2-1]
MRTYKMRRGEYLKERVPDMKAKVEEYFGEVDRRDEIDGVEMYIVDDVLVFDHVGVGVIEHSSKKDELAVDFKEKDVQTLQEEGRLDLASEAMEKKNEFLEEVTGRDAKARRDSMKRSVEDESPDIDS